LARCLEAYFEQSEQLSTRIWLSADANSAAGLMLQELPSKTPDKDRWQHLTAIADTIQNDELLTLDADALLYRLYHQDAVRLFEAKPLVARCQCSSERVEKALLSIGQAELNDIIQERGQVETNCEFCNRLYQFSPSDIAAMFDESTRITRH
jgi:molecular chaperone Hsp33